MLVPLGGVPPAVHDRAWIAPTAVVAGRAQLGDQVSVWYSAVVRADFDAITIGARSNIQDGAVLHTDPGLPMVVGTGVTVGHGAVLHGCVVEDDVLIGMGAIVMNGAVIGAESMVAAGALVPAGAVVPAGSLFLGAPGKVRRGTTDDERLLIRLSADEYVKLASLHAH